MHKRMSPFQPHAPYSPHHSQCIPEIATRHYRLFWLNRLDYLLTKPPYLWHRMVF